MRILSESCGCSCRDSTGPNDFPHLYSSGTLKRGIQLQIASFNSAYSEDSENLQTDDKTKHYAAPRNIWKIYSLCSASQLHFYLVKNPNLSTHYLTPQTQSATEVHIRGYRKPLSKTSVSTFFFSTESNADLCGKAFCMEKCAGLRVQWAMNKPSSKLWEQHIEHLVTITLDSCLQSLTGWNGKKTQKFNKQLKK